MEPETNAVEAVLNQSERVLTEGSMLERLRRDPRLVLDPDIAHAGLIYDPATHDLLADVHREYIAVARRAGLPMILSASTWRASAQRVRRSRFAGEAVNEDNMAFLRRIRDDASEGPPLLVAGVLGPANDAYDPSQSLTTSDAARYHAAQADQLTRGGAELLVAMTLPALREALGMGHAMSWTGLPWLLSFVVRREGTLLDGTPLDQAIDRLDQVFDPAPIGYLVNCVHPTVLEAALARSPAAATRILGLKANASALTPEELDGSADLHSEEPVEFAAAMEHLHARFGLKVLGGCCGTGTDHIARLAGGHPDAEHTDP